MDSAAGDRLFDLFVDLALLQMVENSLAHVPDVLSWNKGDAILLVNVLAVPAYLFDKDLTTLFLIDRFQSLLLVVFVCFWQLCIDFSRLSSIPANR